MLVRPRTLHIRQVVRHMKIFDQSDLSRFWDDEQKMTDYDAMFAEYDVCVICASDGEGEFCWSSFWCKDRDSYDQLIKAKILPIARRTCDDYHQMYTFVVSLSLGNAMLRLALYKPDWQID